MKKTLLLAICVLLTAGNAFAYIQDKVLMTSSSSPDTESLNIANGYLNGIARNLGNRFRCLDVITRDEVSALLGWARMQQLMGTPEEQQMQLKDIGDSMGAKYLILVDIQRNQADPATMVAIKGLNRKNERIIFSIAQKFSSPEAAWNSATAMFDRVAEGFSESLSEQEGGYGEICPFTGRVDVYREVTQNREKQTKQKTYCNGMDQDKSETEKYTHSVREVWSLERIGNPDTKGGVEAIFLDETVEEELDSCYVCGPDEIGRHIWNKTVSESGGINGLSEKSQGESIKNKDATIRLHFNKDGTYTVTVKAASEAGKKTKTVRETATGLCNNFNKSDPPTSTTRKLEFEYTFGPFAGTPFDTGLSGQKELKFFNEEIKESTILRIDFQLERASR